MDDGGTRRRPMNAPRILFVDDEPNVLIGVNPCPAGRFDVWCRPGAMMRSSR